MKKILIVSFRAIVIVAFAFVSIQSNAQAPTPPSGIPGISGSGTLGNGDPVGSGSASVPFDGGMSLMLAASGIGYAAKKLKRK